MTRVCVRGSLLPTDAVATGQAASGFVGHGIEGGWASAFAKAQQYAEQRAAGMDAVETNAMVIPHQRELEEQFQSALSTIEDCLMAWAPSDGPAN